MNFICQNQIIKELQDLALMKRQSILIDGPSGSGKTYLAKQYAKMIGIDEFEIINPTVNEIRSTIEECINIENPVVLCIENLDVGVKAAAYSLLKFLEEPYINVYIIVTCRNIKMVPDTIISRSSCLSTCPPILTDLDNYGNLRYPDKYPEVHPTELWKCVRTFKDVDTICNLTDIQIAYIMKLGATKFNGSISQMVWDLGHFEDNVETPIEFVIRYIMEKSTSPSVKECGIECIKDMTQGRIAKHTVLTKFLFELKYAC